MSTNSMRSAISLENLRRAFDTDESSIANNTDDETVVEEDAYVRDGVRRDSRLVSAIARASSFNLYIL